ncbi:MAG: alpha-amylase family glycosyl hydrolase [Salinivirgaceae bacterium]|jgi:glycosidase|nr:alpha-amylase family glycosyl hydrolase [Salinivirgaceae bacterium]
MTVNIYQVFTRLFRNDNGQNVFNGSIAQNGCSKFNDFDGAALRSIKEMRYTHLWLTGVIRHATATDYSAYGIGADCPQIVKGKAGSPYAIKDYFDVSPDLACDVPNRMNEFKQLVKRCHDNDLQVIIDFVPNHVCRQYRSSNRPDGVPDLGETDDRQLNFSPMNNFYYIPGERFIIPEGIEGAANCDYHEQPAKATGNDIFRANPGIDDWYETIKLNYGIDYTNGRKEHFDPKPNTWHRMHEILVFWAHIGVDGFRVDMAEMVPVAFWHWVISAVKEQFPEVTFTAEVYKPEEYRTYLKEGNFDWLYDKEQFYNVVRDISLEKQPASRLTQIWQQQEGIGTHMLRFMENHDEVRVASELFMGDSETAKPAMVLAATMHAGPLMIYFGQELGVCGDDAEGFSGHDGRTTIFDYWRVEQYQKWVNTGAFDSANLNQAELELKNWYSDLLTMRLSHATAFSGGFYDLMWINQHVDNKAIYSFLRYSADDVVLVILNFDKHNGREVDLILNAHVFEAINRPINQKYELSPIFGSNTKIELLPSQTGNLCGIFHLEPISGCVFRLK